MLVEKPFVTELDEARELVELAEPRRAAARRRPELAHAERRRRRSSARCEQGRIGSVSHVVFRYLRDRETPHLPDYLFDEPDPILWAMGVHHFDLFRYVLGEEIVESTATRPGRSGAATGCPRSTTCGWRPSGGVVISYVASFSSRNAHIPQESLQVEGELGTIYNDSDYFEPPLWLSLRGDDGGPST